MASGGEYSAALWILAAGYQCRRSVRGYGITSGDRNCGRGCKTGDGRGTAERTIGPPGIQRRPGGNLVESWSKFVSSAGGSRRRQQLPTQNLERSGMKMMRMMIRSVARMIVTSGKAVGRGQGNKKKTTSVLLLITQQIVIILSDFNHFKNTIF